MKLTLSIRRRDGPTSAYGRFANFENQPLVVTTIVIRPKSLGRPKYREKKKLILLTRESFLSLITSRTLVPPPASGVDREINCTRRHGTKTDRFL